MGISATGIAIEGNSSEGITTGKPGQVFFGLRTHLAPKDWLQASLSVDRICADFRSIAFKFGNWGNDFLP